MSVEQVVTYRFTCDNCGKIEFVHDIDDPALPSKWSIVQTKFSGNAYLCPKCSKKVK